MQHTQSASKRIVPTVLPLFALLLGTLVSTQKFDVSSHLWIGASPQSLSAQTNTNETDIIYCDQALAQEKDELALLVNQEEPTQNPCLYMSCAGLF